MATGNASNLYGARPSSGNPMGRPGTGEENLRAYTGLRVEEAVYTAGANITQTFIVPGSTLGTGTLPRALTRQNNAAGVPRTRLPLPMALVAQFAAQATPVGTHVVTIRVLGRNQFGEQIQEDITLSVAASGTSAITAMNKIFSRIDAVLVISEQNTNSADTVLIDFRLASNPKIGLPIRCRSIDDVESILLGVYVAGVWVFTDLGQNAGTAFTVDIKEQSFTPTFAGAFNDTDIWNFRIRCRTSIGMDQGYNQGDKYIRSSN